MLTPAHPAKSDPSYRERLQQYRRDLEDKQRHPHNWGMVHSAPPAPRERRPHTTDEERPR